MPESIHLALPVRQAAAKLLYPFPSRLRCWLTLLTTLLIHPPTSLAVRQGHTGRRRPPNTCKNVQYLETGFTVYVDFDLLAE